MKDYKINRTGLRKMMTSDPQLHRALHTSAQTILGVARSLAPRDRTRDKKPPVLSSSGRVEDLGVQGVQSGERRMTVAVVFHTPYAAIVEKRVGFLSGAVMSVSRGRKT